MDKVKSTFWLSITLQSPLYIGSVKPDFNFLSTKELIPGSVIRGAIAEYFLYQNEPDEIKKFIDGVRFGFFKPSKSVFSLSLLFPITSMTCKNSPGFLHEKRHGIFDSLIPLLAYHELKSFGAKITTPFFLRCKQCGARMDKEKGFYIKERHYEKVKVHKASQTKVAINPKTRASEEGMLYSITAVEPSIVFLGKVFIEEGKIPQLKEAIEKVGLGGFTTRGYGKVILEKQDDLSKEIPDIKTRIKEFNDKLTEIWKDLISVALNKEDLPKKPEYTYLTVTLISPGILKDKAGLPGLKLNIQINDKPYNPIVHFSASEFVGGWSTAWGLPKETELGTQMGSVFVFKITEKDQNTLFEELKKLEEIGVGERKEEGYGEILICHPFHKEVMPV